MEIPLSCFNPRFLYSTETTNLESVGWPDKNPVHVGIIDHVPKRRTQKALLPDLRIHLQGVPEWVEDADPVIRHSFEEVKVQMDALIEIIYQNSSCIPTILQDLTSLVAKLHGDDHPENEEVPLSYPSDIPGATYGKGYSREVDQANGRDKKRKGGPGSTNTQRKRRKINKLIFPSSFSAYFPFHMPIIYSPFHTLIVRAFIVRVLPVPYAHCTFHPVI